MRGENYLGDVLIKRIQETSPHAWRKRNEYYNLSKPFEKHLHMRGENLLLILL